MKIKNLLTWLRNPGESLSQRVVHGGIWVFLLRITTRGFSLIRTVVLARVLAPNDFGLFGIAMLSLASLRAFSRTGFNQALIQKKENTELYLNSAWTVQVIRGAFLATILSVGAPLVGIFFGEPRAVPLIRVIALSVFIRSLRNIGIVYFKKELEFHKQFFYKFGGAVSDLVVALTTAIIFRSVWALILGLLAKSVAQLLISYVIHKFRPTFSWDFPKINELFNFGKWILGSSVVIFLLTQGDDIFLGRYLGATALGLYQLAYKVSNTPATEITKIISRVTFPAYSKLQDKLETLRESYIQTLQLTLFFAFPLAAGIAVLSYDFVNIFLGDKWLPMVPALQVLTIFGTTRAFNATTGPLFQAKGRPEILTKISTLQLVILIPIIFPLTKIWGIVGTSVAVIIPNFIAGFFASYKIVEMLDINVVNFLKLIIHPLFGASFMFAAVLLVKNLFQVNIVVFALLILMGAMLYLSTMYLLNRRYNLGYLNIFKKANSSI